MKWKGIHAGKHDTRKLSQMHQTGFGNIDIPKFVRQVDLLSYELIRPCR